MDNLIEEGIVEYLAPEEIENIYCAESYETFITNIASIDHSYTHIAIEQNIFGLVELSAPNTNHTPATRITYFTNQRNKHVDGSNLIGRIAWTRTHLCNITAKYH